MGKDFSNYFRVLEGLGLTVEVCGVNKFRARDNHWYSSVWPESQEGYRQAFLEWCKDTLVVDETWRYVRNRPVGRLEGLY